MYAKDNIGDWLQHENGWLLHMYINAPVRYFLGFDFIDKKLKESHFQNSFDHFIDH